MIRVGIAGIGFMGWIHYLAYQKTKGIQLAAIAEPNEVRLSGDWREIQGNFGPPGEQVDLTGIAAYKDFHDMLADPDVDLVDCCLPPSMHCEAAVAALEAGKHVFCEKPMALTSDECERMVDAAKAAERLLFIGHVLPYFPEYAKAREVIASGEFGKPLGGTFKRVISDPLWLKDFYDPDRVGGPMLDLHVHDAHFIRLLFGMPTAVTTQGRMRGDVVEYFSSQFRFADPALVVSAVSGVINQQGRPFTHGFEIHLEKATMHFEFAGYTDEPMVAPMRLLTPDGETTQPKLAGGDPTDAFAAEIEEVVRCVSANEPSDVLSGDLARDAIVLCHKQTESVKTASTVEI